jgi:hypothetical protein
VLLADSLLAGTGYASATPRPDYQANEYAWNLGDIPPLGVITVTVTLTGPLTMNEIVALDNGAQAWGTFQGQAVYAAACPVTLSPAALDGEPVTAYLQPTLEANSPDPEVVNQAGRLCPGGETAFFEYRPATATAP